MFKLDKEYIKENSSSYAFDRGLEFHFGNRVRSIQFNPQKRLFTASVYDLKERNISVSFNAEGGLISAQCGCRLPGKQSGVFCEHLVAVLLLIQQRDSEGFFSQLRDREKARKIFDLFSFPQAAGQGESYMRREAAHIDSIYVLPVSKLKGAAPLYDSIFSQSPERNTKLFFRLRSGASSYMIKNIERFIQALEKKRQIDFSKKFTFDPNRHILDGFDAELGDFLLEINENNHSGKGAGPNVFSDKFIFLTDRQFHHLLDIYAKYGKPLMINAGATTIEADLHSGDVPLSFKLTRDANDIILKVENADDLIPLTTSGDTIYKDGAVYRLPKPQSAIMRPFLHLLDSYKDNDFRFVSEDRSRFVSEVLPAIERLGALSIDAEVSALIEKSPIVADIYLDRENKAVSAEVLFRYGETEINPFTALSKTKTENPDGRIIARDAARENEILDILAESDFKVKNGKINLYNDDSIFYFIVDILPRLQKYADIYYSQEFRRMSVRRNIGFRANVSLSGDGADKGGNLAEQLIFNFDTEFIDRDELIEIMRSIREKKRYYKLRDGSLLSLGDRETQDVSRLLDAIDASDGDVSSGRVVMPRYRALYLDYLLRNSELRHVGRDRILRDFIRALSEPAENEYAAPQSVENVLRDYQRTGFKWLKTLSAYSLGGILADDMGLGKTLQVLVLLLSIKEERVAAAQADAAQADAAQEAATAVAAARVAAGAAALSAVMSVDAPSLIIAPTSLIYNWCAEIEKFTPSLRYLAISGSKAERARLIASIPGYDVVITSYPLIRRDYDDYKKIYFSFCILDEAQYIKNPNSQNALSVKCLNTRSRFALTGTPIENRLTDLWSIFDFVLPGYLRDAESFTEKYANAGAGDGYVERRSLSGGVDEDDVSDDADSIADGTDSIANGSDSIADGADSIANGSDGATDYAAIITDTAVNGIDGAVDGIDGTVDGIKDKAGRPAIRAGDATAMPHPAGLAGLAGPTGPVSPAGPTGPVSPAGPSSHVGYAAEQTGSTVTSHISAIAAPPADGADDLSWQIRPFLLRRLKEDVLRELPDKIDTRMYAQMTDGQKKIYMVYLEKIRMQIDSEISAKGFEKSQIYILAALTRLRQICCHPSLFIEDYKDDSGKLLLLQELIREAIGGGHRLLLFSQFTRMLAIIRAWADKEGIVYHYIDGQVKPFDRHRMINEFNNGAGDMFLLSLKAGGAGVNLTGADTVIHYDPWWNPAVEDQATDRAYRIGQRKTVQVIKLLTAGSIEEKIYDIQERKKQLIDAVIRPGETFLTKMTKADLDEILSEI